MKAMEDQVVQEEPGYQDDEVNLLLIENYMQQMFKGILTVLRNPWRDRRSQKTIREFNAFKILFQSTTKKISFPMSLYSLALQVIFINLTKAVHGF